MRQGVLTMLALAAGVLCTAGPASAQVKAGVGAVDATWHVGASAGQYASDGSFVGVHGVDPNVHSYRRSASYGVQSRLQARALVIEGPDGARVAIVKNDLYIPQDLLWRRTAQLLEAGGSGIGRDNLTIAVTHNHSSPYYSSPSWGVWAFQDVFDVRFYDYYAKRMALAVERAAASLRPVRVGASVSHFDKTHRNSFGPAVADDGTPAGYPNSESDHDMTVLRFDELSGKPLAVLVNFALHPEFLNGNDLISADYIGPLERMVDRETKALTIWTQGSVGTAEPERSSYHSVHERLEFTHREYAQAEYGARLMADAVVDTWRDVARGTPEDPARYVPPSASFPVAVEDRWFPGPLSHPYPGVSNCRTDKALGGDPQLPVVGLPDCQGPVGGLSTLADLAGLPAPPEPPSLPIDPGLSTDDFQAIGIPVPENYSAPAYTALEEDVSVHLQAIRLGEILLTVCSCEQWSDQSRNIETRTNREQGDLWVGYDWSERCTPRVDGGWDCPDPRDESKLLPPVGEKEYRRMRAQVRNDAAGWNAPAYVLEAESEPTDPERIKGNYTHTELPPGLGYTLTVPVGMANDYNGYIATYREYQRGDHYRKALTAWGPHSSDYMATRLVGMGGQLKGGPVPPREPLEEKAQLDLAANDARAELLGNVGGGLVDAFEALLPDDGPVTVVRQPADVERFSAAFFGWTGGSNFTDNPEVRVQRLAGGGWTDFADQSGEIPVTLRFPQGEEVASYLQGGQRWEWTAHFEAFAAPFNTGAGRATPAGRYRFVVEGRARSGGKGTPYRIVSNEFQVRPWSGIVVEDLRVEAGGWVSFRVGPRRTLAVTQGGPPLEAELGPIDYPDSYESPARFISAERTAIRDPAAPTDASRIEWYCFACTFRPWLDTGNAVAASVTFVDRRGRRRSVAAAEQAGRWRTRARLEPGGQVFVAAGAVRDTFDNLNGSASGAVRR